MPWIVQYKWKAMTETQEIPVYTPVYAMEYEHGIICLDTGFVRDRMAGCYLLEEGQAVALIEVGTNFTVPRILSVLKHRGWSLEDVQYVIVTHVHLDHAGGAGEIMQLLPNAKLLVHPRGARHLIDPSRLEASARAVYGDSLFDQTYGTLIPVDQQRVQEMQDGDSMMLGQRRLLFVDTPGHARHHFCIWDEKSQGWFTGDTFGLSYRELDTNRPFIFPTTTPVQFDPKAMHGSIDRLMSTQPRYMYLTHFGRVDGVPRLAEDLHLAVDKLVELTRKNGGQANSPEIIAQAMMEWLLDAVRKHGCELDKQTLIDLLMPDVQLNTQGLMLWMEKDEDT